MSIERLREIVAAGTLSARSQEFAQSLLNAHQRYGQLTPRQQPYVQRLIDQASRPAATTAPAAVNVGNMQGVVALFDRARAHLRRPAIVLSVPDLPHPVRLSVAGSTARVPGSINVVQADYTGNDFRNRTWYGRVMQDGTFHPGRDVTAENAARIATRLQALAADPVTVAAEHGRLTGRCCFCNRHLEDERSTAVGYGPTCAEHYGLPWGSREAAPTPPRAVTLRLGNETRVVPVMSRSASPSSIPQAGNRFSITRDENVTPPNNNDYY